MDFTVNGQPVRLDRAGLFDALKGRHPRLDRTDDRQRRLVKIRRAYWPVQQAVQVALEAHGWQSPRRVPTSEATRVLEALGFAVITREEPR